MLGGLGVYLAQFRNGARGTYVAAARVERESRVGVPDGKGSETFSMNVVWEGRVKVESYEPYETSKVSAGDEVVIQRHHIHFPVDAGPFEIGDIVTITSEQFTTQSAGTKYRVAGLHEKSLQTAQRVLVDQII